MMHYDDIRKPKSNPYYQPMLQMIEVYKGFPTSSQIFLSAS